jgi:hypothetical protein
MYYSFNHFIIGFGSQKIVSLIICDPKVLYRVDLLLDDQETPAAAHSASCVLYATPWGVEGGVQSVKGARQPTPVMIITLGKSNKNSSVLHQMLKMSPS